MSKCRATAAFCVTCQYKWHDDAMNRCLVSMNACYEGTLYSYTHLSVDRGRGKLKSREMCSSVKEAQAGEERQKPIAHTHTQTQAWLQISAAAFFLGHRCRACSELGRHSLSQEGPDEMQVAYHPAKRLCFIAAATKGTLPFYCLCPQACLL